MISKELYGFIQLLQKTSGSLKKKEMLSQYKDDKLLQKYLQYVYDEVNYTYGKSKLPIIPDTKEEKIDQDDNLDEMFKLLEDMNSGKLRGSASNEAMVDYLILKPDFYQDLLFYVLKRNIKAKMNARSINEIIPKLIHIAPYQRCQSEAYVDRIKYSTDGNNHGALAQLKADGTFLNICIHKDYDEVTCLTRKGHEVPNYFWFDTFSKIGDWLDKSSVLHGELLVKNEDGSIMDRATGNGLLNGFYKRWETYDAMLLKIDKATPKRKKTLNAELEEMKKTWNYIAHNLVFEVWDIVNLKDWENLYSDETVKERFEKVKTLISKYNEWCSIVEIPDNNCEIRIIESKIVYSHEEMMNFYQEQIDKGLEGIVVKNLDAAWEHDENRQGIIKLKDFKENDLRIVGYKEADPDSEFAGGIGAYICESSDGIVKVNVSGMKRHERGLERVSDDSSEGLKIIDNFDFNQHIGKIAAVKYNELIKNNQGGYSLFLPAILEIRESNDKTEADSFEKIKQTAKYKGK